MGMLRLLDCRAYSFVVTSIINCFCIRQLFLQFVVFLSDLVILVWLEFLALLGSANTKWLHLAVLLRRKLLDGPSRVDVHFRFLVTSTGFAFRGGDKVQRALKVEMGGKGAKGKALRSEIYFLKNSTFPTLFFKKPLCS